MGGKASDLTDGEVVQGKDSLTREPLKETFLDHLERAGFAHFFGRLKDEIDGAGKIASL